MVRACAIYARISNDPEGDKLGVGRQVTDCEAEAARREWPIAGRYVDDDKSAWSGKLRPEYARLVADIEARKIDAVLFWHPDRLTRQPIEMEAFVAACRKYRVEVAWIGGQLAGGDDDGLLLLRILAAVASDSSAKTSKRIRRKNDERALAGLPTGGGTRPFGYLADRVTIDPAEAILVRQAATKVLGGESVLSIANDWNERGIETPAGRSWTVQTLRRMLASARLSGQREHRGEIVAKGVWEPILTPEQTASLRAVLDGRAASHTRRVRRYFLTGLLRCGLCDRPLVARPAAGGMRRYVCVKGLPNGGCGRLATNAEPIEALLAEAIQQRLDAPEVGAALAGTAAQDAASAAHHVALARAQEQLEELATAYGERVLTFGEMLAARKPIEARIDASRKALAKLSRTAAIDPYVGRSDDLRAAWGGLTLNEQRSIAGSLVDRVTVGPAVRGRAIFDPSRVSVLWRL
jgi:site-specific DNA recombinase